MSRLPVCSSVSTSSPSSSVPKPPGSRQTASHSLTNISLRVKKYFMCTSLVSPAMIGLAYCSKGSMMFSPIEFSRPAPTWPASMMPLAAPVTTSQLCSAIARPKGDGLAIRLLVGPRARRAEDGHLAPRAIGRENLEGVAQLAQRAAEDLQVAARVRSAASLSADSLIWSIKSARGRPGGGG